MTPKRARDATASGDTLSSASKRRRRQRSSGAYLSSEDIGDSRLSVGDAADDELARLQQETLRISNEMLRSENEQLQVELEILEESNRKLEGKVEAGQQRVQALEGDLARWYRLQKRDAELEDAKHAAELKALQGQLNALLKHSGLASATGVGTELQRKASSAGSVVAAAEAVPLLVTPNTAHEVDSFLATCVQWQSNLASASVDLEKQVSKIEEDEVKCVVTSVVASVEIAAREEGVVERERELEAGRGAMLQQQVEMERAMQRMKKERDEVDAFEALERRVLEDRVAELEVQLTQNRLREFEKDEEITSLRAEQDELSASSCVIPKQEWEAHLSEHQKLGEESDEWRLQCETQSSEVARLQETLRTTSARVQELEGKLQVAQAAEETHAFEALEKKILEERIEELEAQLQSQQSQQSSDDAALAEQEQQRVKLVDDLEAAQLQLSVAEAEANVKKNEVARLLNDKAELKKQLKLLAGDLKRVAPQMEEYKAQASSERMRSSQLSAELKRLQDANNEIAAHWDAQGTEEQVKLLQQVRELKEQERVKNQSAADKEQALKQRVQELLAQRKQLESERDNEVAQLKRENAQLLADREGKRRLHGTVESSTSAAARDPDSKHPDPAVDSSTSSEALERLVREKRAMQEFFRCYFEAAETKCRQLLHELSQREALSAFAKQQARDSCELLRRCTVQQGGAAAVGDENSVRRAILEAVSTLERIA